MPIPSLIEARALWEQVSDYYTLFEDKKIFTYLWQAAIEKVNEVGEDENAAAEYSIEKILSTKKRFWDYIKNVDGDYIIDQNGNALADNVISIPTLQDGINAPDDTYIEGTNYSIADQKLTWITSQPSDTYLYAPEVIIENPNLEKYFNDGFFDLIFEKFTYAEKKEILRLIWYGVKYGPTEHNLLALAHALAGIPFNKYPAIGMIVGSDYVMYYQIPVYAFISDERVHLGRDKGTHTVNISDNMIVNASGFLSVNDYVYYNETYYSVIEIIGNDALLDKTIANDTGVSITTYTYLSMLIATNCVLLDPAAGVVYSLFADITFPEIELLLVHQNNIVFDSNDKASIIEDRETLTPYSTFTVNFSNGDILYAFTNLQKAFYIYGWEDNYIDASISGTGYGPLTPSLIKSIYNVEVDRVYSIIDEVPADLTKFEVHETADIVTGDSLLIKNYISIDEYDIISREQDDDGYWWVTTGNNYDYHGRQLVMIRKMLEINNTGDNDYYYTGGIAVILEGIYDRVTDTYKLKSDIDLSSSDFDANVKIVIMNPTEDTRVIKGLTGDEIEVDAGIDVEQDYLPIVRKSAYANYGDFVKRSLGADANEGDTTINVSSLPTGELYNSILIAGTFREAEICEIDEIAGDTVTLAAALEHDYKSGDIVILLKRLANHGGITFQKYATGNYSTMLSDHPNLKTNINKILDKILPAGYTYRWRVW